MGNILTSCNENNIINKRKICTICKKPYNKCVMYNKKFVNRYVKLTNK